MFVSLIWLFSFLDLPNPQPLIFFFHISVTSKLPCRVCYSSRHLVAFFHESLFFVNLKTKSTYIYHVHIRLFVPVAGTRHLQRDDSASMTSFTTTSPPLEKLLVAVEQVKLFQGIYKPASSRCRRFVQVERLGFRRMMLRPAVLSADCPQRRHRE